jgi:subtilisin-like proprotein convertase family protein
MRRLGVFTYMAALAACCGTATTVLAQAEVEPNDTKTGANLRTLAPGGTITGTSTGSSTLTAGLGSADYFRIKTTPAPLGIYRNTLALTATTAQTSYGFTLRGLFQSAGVITAGSDATFMTATTAASPAQTQTLSWFGFGREEEVFARVTGLSTTTGTYTLTHNRTAVTPTVIAGTQPATGNVTVRISAGAAPAVTDSEFWVYDSNFNPVFGNDGSSVGGGALSSATRNLAIGTYFLAVANANLSNDQAAPTDDTIRSSNVLDFPNALAVSTANLTSAPNGVITLISGSGSLVQNYSLPINTAGPVQWFQFDVVQPATPVGLASSFPSLISNDDLTRISISVTAGLGGSLDTTTVTADVSALRGTASPDNVTLTRVGTTNVWRTDVTVGSSVTGTIAVPLTLTDSAIVGSGSSSASVTVVAGAPDNDVCTGAVVLTPGTPSSPVSNVTALATTTVTASNDGNLPACTTTVARGLWYTITHDTTGFYNFLGCPTGTFDGVVDVLNVGDCLDPSTWTSLGCNDTAPTGVCATGGGAGAVINIQRNAGQTTYVRFFSFGGTGTTTSASVQVDFVGLGGACCATSGACSLVVSSTACASPSVYQGDGTTCPPTPPCPVGIVCCDPTLGSCSVVFDIANCVSPSIPNAALNTCAPGVCPGPVNDPCTGAIAITPGVTVIGNNLGATTLLEGAASCATAPGIRDLWYRYTATTTAQFNANTCGSFVDGTGAGTAHDTVLTVFRTNDCAAGLTTANVILCNDDTTTTNCPAGSTANSFVGPFIVGAGETILIRVATWSSSFASGFFNLTLVDTGATNVGRCCASTGTCSLTLATACTGTSIFTLGGTCTPNDCPAPVKCCNPTTGACTTVIPSACTAPLIPGPTGSTCTVNDCALPAANNDCTGSITLTPDAAATPYQITFQSTATPGWVAGTCGAEARDIFFNFDYTAGVGYRVEVTPVTTTAAQAIAIGTSCQIDTSSPFSLFNCRTASTAAYSFNFVAPAGGTATIRIADSATSTNPGAGTIRVVTVPIVACCNGTSGVCTLRAGICNSGEALQAGGVCSPGICGTPEACCNTINATCSIVTPAFCTASGGVSVGGTVCPPAAPCVVDPPSNDECNGTELIVGAPAVNYQSNIGATPTTGFVANACSTANGRDIFFRFSAVAGRPYRVIITPAVGSAAISTVISTTCPVDTLATGGLIICTTGTTTAAATITLANPLGGETFIRLAELLSTTAFGAGTIRVEEVPIACCTGPTGCTLLTPTACAAAGGLATNSQICDLGTQGEIGPFPIPDATTGVIGQLSRSLTVSNVPGNVTSIAVTLNINHTWAGDIRARLTGPGGASAVLFGRAAGTAAVPGPCPADFAIANGNDIVGTYRFVDTATTGIVTAILTTSPPASGDYRAQDCDGTLINLNSVFASTTANGEWTLLVEDVDEALAGTLNSWQLSINDVVNTPCTNVVACCTSGVCSIALDAAACTGAGGTPTGTTCSPSPCGPAQVACCDDTTGVCTLVTGSCPSGSTQTGTSCSPSPCPQPVACCTPGTGACSIAITCTGGSISQGAGSTCSPNSCPTVCCRGSTCSVVANNLCTAPASPVVGVGTSSAGTTACGVINSPITGCCFADFNKLGGVTIDDIFIYLNAWFAPSPFANVGEPGTPNIDDIFIFLNAWFAGCPTP